MQLHSLHFQQSEHEGDFFWGILFCVLPKVVRRGPDKDDNYPDFYKAKQLSKMSESCLSLPTVDIPQRNPYLLGIEKRRKMHLWARMETPSHVGGSLKWKYLPPVRWVLSHPSRKHTSGTEDTKYRGQSVNGSHFFLLCVSIRPRWEELAIPQHCSNA